MLKRAAALGDEFERKILHEYVAKYGEWETATGTGVKQVEGGQLTWAGLTAKREETLEALRIGADVVFQATFFDGTFVGFADFLVRQDDGSYAVYDTKLARHAKVSALLQLAAYGDQLNKYGIPLSPITSLKLGDRSESHSKEQCTEKGPEEQGHVKGKGAKVVAPAETAFQEPDDR